MITGNLKRHPAAAEATGEDRARRAVPDTLRDGSLRYVIVPGLDGSGPGHWQTRWHAAHADFHWLHQASWDRPVCRDWTAALERLVVRSPKPVVLVAHSLGCQTVAHWALSGTRDHVAGALLVAPADAERSDRLAARARGFAPIPLAPLPFPSVVVASRNDPFIAFDRARLFAHRWGSDFIDAGPLGHINADSRLGDWPDGLGLLASLVENAGLSRARGPSPSAEHQGFRLIGREPSMDPDGKARFD